MIPEELAAILSSLATGEAALESLTAPGPSGPSVEVVSLPGGGRARLFTPTGRARGGHLYIHGGSWSLGSPEDRYVDATCRERCEAASVLVLAPWYRLAPVHVFPAALDDVSVAFEWLGSQTDRVSIGGGSAGANLAAALSLRSAAVCFALLEVPALDLSGLHLDRSLPPECGDPDGLLSVYGAYLGPTDPRDPSASPLLAASLTPAPPTHVMTAELDPIRGDGEAYLDRLMSEGVRATGGRRAGHVHASPAFTACYEPARQWREELLAVLTEVHA